MKRQEISADKYWRHEFPAVMTGKQLVPFLILSIEPLLSTERVSAKRHSVSRKVQLAECVVVKESDFGVNDIQYTCVTHLGAILKEGQVVLG